VIENLLTSSTTRMLEQAVNFTEQRHQVLLEDIANTSTPGYVQKDLSVGQFQASLRDAVSRQRSSNNDAFAPASTDTIAFSLDSSNITAQPQEVLASPVFHDRGARGIESLMGDLADNAIAHNTVTQLLKYKYDNLSRAITMKV
jgi:flagellar basal-body rod protein FlgB